MGFIDKEEFQKHLSNQGLFDGNQFFDYLTKHALFENIVFNRPLTKVDWHRLYFENSSDRERERMSRFRSNLYFQVRQSGVPIKSSDVALSTLFDYFNRYYQQILDLDICTLTLNSPPLDFVVFEFFKTIGGHDVIRIFNYDLSRFDLKYDQGEVLNVGYPFTSVTLSNGHTTTRFPELCLLDLETGYGSTMLGLVKKGSRNRFINTTAYQSLDFMSSEDSPILSHPKFWLHADFLKEGQSQSLSFTGKSRCGLRFNEITDYVQSTEKPTRLGLLFQKYKCLSTSLSHLNPNRLSVFDIQVLRVLEKRCSKSLFELVRQLYQQAKLDAERFEKDYEGLKLKAEAWLPKLYVDYRMGLSDDLRERIHAYDLLRDVVEFERRLRLKSDWKFKGLNGLLKYHDALYLKVLNLDNIAQKETDKTVWGSLASRSKKDLKVKKVLSSYIDWLQLHKGNTREFGLITILKTTADLNSEGLFMKNCVGGYANHLLKGQSVFLHWVYKGIGYTVRVGMSNGKVLLIEMKARYNELPDKAVEQLFIDTFIEPFEFPQL